MPPSNDAIDLTPFSVDGDGARLQAFARATGQDDPVYSDPAAARAAGHPSLPVAPTFLFCLEMQGPAPMEMYERLGPITRHTLSRYADASGDHNGLHTDRDHARRAGYPDVFAHGMLSAAYLARVVTHWVDPSALRSLGVRFVAITHLEDEVHCRAVVAKKSIEHGENCVTLQLFAQNQQGDMKITGTAVVAMA
jgi:acyl dehydratase